MSGSEGRITGGRRSQAQLASSLPCGRVRILHYGPESIATGSKHQAHQLFHRQREDAEHQVAPHLARAANPQVPPAKLVLEPSVHPLHGRALPGAPRLGRHLADAALRQRLPLPLSFHLRPPAGIEVDDRHMPQLFAEGPDLRRVIGAVHQIVEAVDPTRGQPR